MKSLKYIYVGMALWVITFSLNGIIPIFLQCEYRVNPSGVEQTHPRLSWLLKPDPSKRGERQTAYQILVASHPSILTEDKADLWDTGKIPSDETLNVKYNGRPLQAGQRCYWKVRVWDQDDMPSQWSEIASWIVGLKNNEWKGEWIGYDRPRQLSLTEPPLEGAYWVWFAGDKETNKPKARRYFARDFLLPNTKIEKSQLWISADDYVCVYINGQLLLRTEGQDAWKLARQIDVTDILKSGSTNYIRLWVDNTAPSPAGLIAKLIVSFNDGTQFILVTDNLWVSSNTAPEAWYTKPVPQLGWQPVQTIGQYGIEPWGKLQVEGLNVPPAVYLRTTFNITKPVKYATLFATALGWYDVFINGKRVNESYFDPGWTDYRKRVYYRTYDVSSLVKEGSNGWAVVLSDGWYSGYIGWARQREHYGKRPRFKGQIIVEYTDGTREVFYSHKGWKASTGPIISADILMGETYDARLEMPGWDTSVFDDSAWSPVDTGAELNPTIEAHPGPEVKLVGTFKPKSITEPQPGVYVIDLGQNFAGIVEIKVQGKPGQKIQIRHAERLNPDGTIYVANLRSAKATDIYICKGQGIEKWSPRFTFHGFQYVELTGIDHPPTQDTITGLALSSDCPLVGEFESSDPILNRLWLNVLWTQRANFIDVPTDCPQRDERLGWTGDAQVYIRTATLNADVHAFFIKWLTDLLDAQRFDGQFPMVAPLVVAGDDGGPAWADAGVICPWTIYEVYGDKELLAKCYPAMKKFIAFCKNRCSPDLLPPQKFHCFGDWLNVDDPTPNEVIYMAYFAYSTMLTAKTAEVLGLNNEATEYWELYKGIRDSFNRAYVKEDGKIHGDSQTAYVLAIAFDLVEGKRAEQAATHLLRKIQERKWHLSTGFIGTKDLMLVLDKIGRNDVAYRLIHNDTYPSWGFSIKHGATTIWERWDGWTPDRGFQDPGMNSFAHYSFGAVYQWMVETIGGIRAASPTYKEIIIKPYPNGLLSWAKVSYRSPRGLIQTKWSRSGKDLDLEVVIPPNTTANIYIPTDDPNQVTESGKPLYQVESIKLVDVNNPEYVVIKVGSGIYQFHSFFTPKSMPGNN